MRVIILFLAMIIPVVTMFGQQTDPKQPMTKEDYLAKSKRQKSGARVMLIGGAVLIGTGYLIGNSKEADFGQAGAGFIMGGIGFLSMVGSIPLFIASGKNKRRAMEVSAELKIQDAVALQKTLIANTGFPALAVRIHLE